MDTDLARAQEKPARRRPYQAIGPMFTDRRASTYPLTHMSSMDTLTVMLTPDARTAILNQLARYVDSPAATDWDHLMAVAAAISPHATDRRQRKGLSAHHVVQHLDVAAALQLLCEHRITVDIAEAELIDALTGAGWTWEQVAGIYGKSTKQAMQQRRQRIGNRLSGHVDFLPPLPEAEPPRA